jgi:hypothetical protein
MKSTRRYRNLLAVSVALNFILGIVASVAYRENSQRFRGSQDCLIFWQPRRTPSLTGRPHRATRQLTSWSVGNN